VGPAAPDSSNQIHDFNPGIEPFPSGLFWTIRIPDDAVASNLGHGTAFYRLSDLHLEDYGSLPNALSNGPSVPATVTFDVDWSGVIERGTTADATNRFRLSFVRTGATIRWSGSSSLGTFESTSVTKVNFAQVAHETNGAFFGS
jgi:hypothetical protein